MTLLGFSALVSGACIDLAGRSCNELAARCNVTSITIQSPGNTWSTGTYALALVVDGAPQQCTMTVPDPPSAAQGACTAIGTALTLSQFCPQSPQVCNSVACSVTVSCLPGQFTMELTMGTPFGPFEAGVQPHVVGMLGLALSLDGAELVNETIAPKATTTEPNGSGCGTCTNASATLSLSDQ